ncbi:Uncharacterised protein [Achromobacter xylosoxidans]|nr:Uncharacterised protein [Achromobacter xylosoxidans]
MRAAIGLPHSFRTNQALLLRIAPQARVGSDLRQQAADRVDLAGQRRGGVTIQGAPAQQRAVAGEILARRPGPDLSALDDDDRADVLGGKRGDRIKPGEIPDHECGRGDSGAAISRGGCGRGRRTGQNGGVQWRTANVAQHLSWRLRRQRAAASSYQIISHCHGAEARAPARHGQDSRIRLAHIKAGHGQFHVPGAVECLRRGGCPPLDGEASAGGQLRCRPRGQRRRRAGQPGRRHSTRGELRSVEVLKRE